MNKIFVTGASGFIGQAVCKALSDLKYSVCGAVRNKDIISQLPNVKYVSIGDIILNPDWKNLLAGYDCVIHCAGISGQNNIISKKIYGQINTENTKKLAEQCAIAGVKKFIFLSSISVLGQYTVYNKPFTHSDKVNPKGNYAQSKYESEKKLLEINAKTSLEVTIIRPPMVYGSNAKGYINLLIKTLNFRLPLPFSLINNKRSFISIDNLVSLLICCIKHPNLKGKVFLVCDGEDISVPEFLKNISDSIGYSLRLFPCPIFLLKFFGSILGKASEINKLITNLQIDDNYTRDTLNWKPPQSVKDGIRKMIMDK
jgi:nucleoside-diphosphate-sugar epimerase